MEIIIVFVVLIIIIGIACVYATNSIEVKE
jgi:hypothetical protein